MYTLKIHWTRSENGEVVDQTTLYIQADEVWTHGEILSTSEMKTWPEGSYHEYRVKDSRKDSSDGDDYFPGRLIKVERHGKSTWYLASHAWLLGSDGKTIERLI